MDVVISGSTGLIGTALRQALRAAGHRPIALTRGQATGDAIAWDPMAGTIDAAALEGVDAVVHLAGAGIADHRWTDAYKAEIMNSRKKSTTLLSRTVAGLSNRPSVMVSGSAIGYYGDRGDEELTEASPAGSGFLPDVCLAWEAATAPAQEAGIRVAHIRTGVVQSTEGGALKKQLPIFKLGFGGRIKSGEQWVSWIAVADEVSAIMHLLTHDVAGAVNLTTPNPVTNADYARILGRVLRRPTALPIPAFGPKLVLGSELANNLLFEGQKVLPTVLQASGYAFQYPTLEGALRALLDKPEAA